MSLSNFFLFILIVGSPASSQSLELGRLKTNQENVNESRCSQDGASQHMRIVCYYPNWVHYREGKLLILLIDTPMPCFQEMVSTELRI